MEEHSTNHYDIPGLVLRRGQAFSFTVTFNREFNPEQHQLYVRLAIGISIKKLTKKKQKIHFFHSIGSRSMISKRTHLRLLVDGTPSGNGWSARTISLGDKQKTNSISIQVDSSPDAIIGKYTVR